MEKVQCKESESKSQFLADKTNHLLIKTFWIKEIYVFEVISQDLKHFSKSMKKDENNYLFSRSISIAA